MINSFPCTDAAVRRPLRNIICFWIAGRTMSCLFCRYRVGDLVSSWPIYGFWNPRTSNLALRCFPTSWSDIQLNTNRFSISLLMFSILPQYVNYFFYELKNWHLACQKIVVSHSSEVKRRPITSALFFWRIVITNASGLLRTVLICFSSRGLKNRSAELLLKRLPVVGITPGLSPW